MNIPPIPVTQTPGLDQWLRDYALAVDRELRQRIPNTVPITSFLLVSPAGKVYSVAVDDAGTLTTTLEFE